MNPNWASKIDRQIADLAGQLEAATAKITALEADLAAFNAALAELEARVPERFPSEVSASRGLDARPEPGRPRRRS